MSAGVQILPGLPITKVMALLLDMYCGAGGASVGYARAGFEVVGIDIEDQPDYPFEFIQADLRDLPPTDLTEFDLVHASPPCQKFTAYRRRGDGVGDDAVDLIHLTRWTLQLLGLPYVIENVPGAPLKDPVQLCGSSFGLDVRRHRLFETSFDIKAPDCDHDWQTPRFPQATNRHNLRCTVEVGAYRIPLDVQLKAMDIDWITDKKSLSQAIPPAYTEYIGNHFRRDYLDGDLQGPA